MTSISSMVAAVALVTTMALGAQASETAPSEPMTVQEHLEAARVETSHARQHRDDAQRVSASKAVIENALRREHLWQAHKHEALARQHAEDARRVASK